MDTWVKLYRKIWKNPIAKKPLYFTIFVFIFSNANKRERKVLIDGNFITTKRGDFIYSMRKISEYFNVPISTIKFVIDYLVKEGMLSTTTSDRFTIFTVPKYNEYQSGTIETKPEFIQYSAHVSLSLRQYNFLCAKYTETKVKQMIEKLDEYKVNHGVKYKSDFHKLNSWVADWVKRKENRYGKGKDKFVIRGLERKPIDFWSKQ